VVEGIGARRDDLVELACRLIAFDTTAREPGHPAREEARLQEFLAGRLERAGATAEIWEPAPDDVAGTALVPSALSFEGRPQMVARRPGHGGGRDLLLNGHIDVVSSEPKERWSSDPNRPEVRDGRLYGRGACDMKGGIASMVFAVEALAAAGVELAGDIVVCTVTDEESTGAGGLAAVAHGVRAAAGIVTEATGFDVLTTCRGSLIPTITVEGRPGHAGITQAHWRDGGAVNAIEKAELVSTAMRRLNADWRGRADHRHPLLPTSDIVPVLISGGEWFVSHPATCRLTYHIEFVPGEGDDGWGRPVVGEIEDWIRRTAEADPWLAQRPPTVEWGPTAPCSEVAADEPIVETLAGCGRDVGRSSSISGLENWHDGATFTRVGGTPCVCFGPGDMRLGHMIDEHVPVDDLVGCAQALAIAAMRFCGP